MMDLVDIQWTIMYSCSRPFYQQLADAVTSNDALWDWAFCPYTITGLGLAGVGVFVLGTGFIGLKNWSESWTLPLTWLAIVTPVLATALLPGGVLRLIGGILTVVVAMVFIGWWYWSGRS